MIGLPGWEGMGKLLIIVGGILIFLGIIFFFGSKIPYIGRLPGDIMYKKGNFHFYFPLATCIILSIFLTLLLNLFLRK